MYPPEVANGLVLEGMRGSSLWSRSQTQDSSSSQSSVGLWGWGGWCQEKRRGWRGCGKNWDCSQ